MRLRIFLLIVVLASGTFLAAPVGAAPTSPTAGPVPGLCVDGTLPSGALSRICVPASGWNGDLIVYAHGYVAFNAPKDFYNLSLPDGTYLPTLVQSLGYAFATTSYRRNGLAIVEGVQDTRELVAKFKQDVRAPGVTYITGASEGGAVTALSAEQSADIFNGGLSLCGPIGDFRKQIDYWGDFRVLYDYFFPGTLPPDAMDIPDDLINGWDSYYQPLVLSKLAAKPTATAQLITTSKAPVIPTQATTIGETTAGILWYNVFATNDGKDQLGGNPYDNSTRIYGGSLNDRGLNAGVQRFKADAAALNALNAYNTTGNPGIPLVTLHTTGDPIVPFWHELLYRQKLRANGNNEVSQISIPRYGHCSFKTNEVLAGFSLMVYKTTGKVMFVPAQYDISDTRAQMDRATLK
jgi:hypothetical protein